MITLSDSMESILGACRYEQSVGCEAGFTMALGPKGWVAKFAWHGTTLKATAGTAEEALDKLQGLVGQRNCIDCVTSA